MLKLRSHQFRFLAIASVLLCSIASAKAQDKVLLRLHLQPGQTFDTGFVSESTSSEVIGKKPITVTILMHFGLHNQVVGVGEDGTINLKTTYQSIAMQMQNSPGEKKEFAFSYDSKNPPKKITPDVQVYESLVGQSVMMTLSSRGEILKEEGMEAALQKTLASIKDPAARSALEKTLRKAITANGRTTSNMVFFPEAPVAIGDSWKFQSGFSPLLVSGKYTLMSLKKGIATLALLASVSMDLKGALFGKSGMGMDYKGTQNGVVHVDEATGLTISSELHQHLTGKLSMKFPKSAPGKIKDIEVQLKAENTMRGWTVKLPQ